METPTIHSRLPKYVRIAEEIRRHILVGEWQSESKLPRLSEMRQQFAASLDTLDKALGLLEEEGTIRRTQGSGVYILRRRHARTGLIGFVGIAPRPAERFGSQLYFAHLIEGAKAAARQHDLNLMLLDYESPASAWERLDAVLTGSPWAHDIEAVREKLGASRPWVSLLVEVENVTSVVIDEAAGVRLAIEHLLELGHRRIAYLIAGARGNPHYDLRLAAYQESLHRAGIEPELRWVRHLRAVGEQPTGFVGAGRQRMREWLEEDWNEIGCTALLAHNDQTAIGALESLAEAGLSVPRDLSVVGFDGTEAADFARPPLTTIKVPLFEVGAKGIEMLWQQLNEENSVSGGSVLPVQLREGGSTASPGI